MNPDTNLFESMASQAEADPKVVGKILDALGEPVSSHASRFDLGEKIEIKGYMFTVYAVGQDFITFKPVGLP